MLGQVCECGFRGTFSYHQVDSDQALEDGRPCGVMQAVLKGAEDLADTSLAGMGCDEDVLDVLCLGRRKLCVQESAKAAHIDQNG